jgi:hypothetical protein
MFNIKKQCALVSVFLLSVSAFCNDAKGDFTVSGGLSVGALLPHFVDVDFGKTANIGGRIQADYAIKRFMSIGLESGFASAKVGDTDFSVGAVPVFARIVWHPLHFNNVNILPYIVGKAGLSFGMFTQKSDEYNWKNIDGGFAWGMSFGTRFFFNENVGLFIEGGYECLDMAWEHPGMALEKWEETVSARTFGVVGVSVKFGKSGK